MSTPHPRMWMREPGNSISSNSRVNGKAARCDWLVIATALPPQSARGRAQRNEAFASPLNTTTVSQSHAAKA